MKVRTVVMLWILTFAVATAIAEDSTFAKKEITTYPFAASVERATAIQGRYKRVTVGMVPADVKAILGEPDEILPLYKPVVKNGKQIGYTYWYVIRRATQHGSVNEKQEALVRVSFDLNAQVTKIDHWGF